MAIEDKAEDQEVEAGGIDAVLVEEDVAVDMADQPPIRLQQWYVKVFNFISQISHNNVAAWSEVYMTHNCSNNRIQTATV